MLDDEGTTQFNHLIDLLLQSFAIVNGMGEAERAFLEPGLRTLLLQAGRQLAQISKASEDDASML